MVQERHKTAVPSRETAQNGNDFWLWKTTENGNDLGQRAVGGTLTFARLLDHPTSRVERLLSERWKAARDARHQRPNSTPNGPVPIAAARRLQAQGTWTRGRTQEDGKKGNAGAIRGPRSGAWPPSATQSGREWHTLKWSVTCGIGRCLPGARTGVPHRSQPPQY